MKFFDGQFHHEAAKKEFLFFQQQGMRCHSVVCGMASQTQSAMRLDTRNTAAAHTMP
jgi:hypothetical protein